MVVSAKQSLNRCSKNYVTLPRRERPFNRFAQLDAVLREAADTESVGSISQASASSVSAPTPIPATTRYARALLAIAAVIVIGLTATLYYQNVNKGRNIARITGMNGTLTWIGDGGQIVQGAGSSQTETRWSNVLSEGAELPGGTIEGMAPDSWFELEFHDGSTGMISGDSILTFSDERQKELRLKQGRFSADVRPQPEGKPMLIHTPAAVLEVIGTQFDVEAGPESTMLYVREGKVQIRRVGDGKTVDVPAGHRVVAAADSDMLLRPVAPDRTWAQTPFWQNISASGDPNSIATQETRDHDGTRNLLLSEELASLPAQDTDYIIRSGDKFKVGYAWLGGIWWTAQDQIAIRLFTTDNDLISGTATTFATLLSGPSKFSGEYEAASGRATVHGDGSQEEALRRDRYARWGGGAPWSRPSRQLPVGGDALSRGGIAGRLSIAGGRLARHSPTPTAAIIIGGNLRNGDFNRK